MCLEIHEWSVTGRTAEDMHDSAETCSIAHYRTACLIVLPGAGWVPYLDRGAVVEPGIKLVDDTLIPQH
jgi:hypothetical protein